MTRRESLPEPTSRSNQAMGVLLAALDSGRWPAMSRLPGELHLAEELGVARGTVRRALAQLSAQGRLLRRPHAGFVVPGTAAGVGALSGTTLLIGTPIADLPFVQDYPAAVLLGAQRAAANGGTHLMLITTARWDRATQQAMIGQRPTAVVMSDIYTGDRDEARRLRETLTAANVPLIWHADPDDGLGCDCTSTDQAQGARALVACLRQAGRTVPVILSTTRAGLPWAERRLGAIAEAWAGDGIGVQRVQIEIEDRKNTDDEGSFRRRTRTYAGYLAELIAGGIRPDALFATSDSDVPAVIAACRLVGLDPHHDVDVVGFDGYWKRLWELRYEPFPPLATVRANQELVGRRLIELAIRQRGDGDQPRGERTPVELIRLR